MPCRPQTLLTILLVGVCLRVVAAPVPGSERFPKAEIRPLNGAGTLFVNGAPCVRLGINSGADHAASLAEKLDGGTRLVQTRTIRFGGPSLRQEARAELTASVEKILDALPDAWIVLRLFVEPVNEFLEAHPEAWVTGAQGQQLFQDRFNRYFMDVPPHRPSWASVAWREYVDADIRDLLSYVAAQPWAGQIIGINFSAGHTGEFDQWFGGEGWPGGNGGDWARESQSRFRLWLKERYQGDPARLQQAWKKDGVSFETAAIASNDVPIDATTGFVNATLNQARQDYNLFYGRQIGETIEAWCRSAKEASGGRLICGAMAASGDGGGRLMNTSPWVDFGAGPGTYFYRQPGNNTRHDFTGEELRRHSKWFFDEMDYRTLYYGGVEYGVETLDKTLAVLAREHALITTEGAGGYWFEFRSITYRHPAIWRLFRQQAEISELAARHPRGGQAQVAVVYSEAAGSVGRGAGDLRSSVLCRLAAPYHAVFLETLMEQAGAELPYKVYFFVGTPELTTPQRDFVRTRLMTNDNWLVFFRPAGASWPGAAVPFSLSNSVALHGIGLAAKPGARRDATLTVAAGCPLPDVTPGAALADPADDKPRSSRPTAWTVVADPDATPLAVWADGATAAGLKRHGGWTAVYLPSLRVSPPFLRSVVKAAGVHQYVDNGDDVIFAAGPLLNFHTRTNGVRHIRLPVPSDLYDLYARQFVGRGQAAYDVSMGPLENHLYYLGDPRGELAGIGEALDQEILARRTLVERRARQRLERMGQPISPGPYPLLDNGKLCQYLFLGPVPVPDVPSGRWLDYEKEVLSAVQLDGEPAALKPAAFKPERMRAMGENGGGPPSPGGGLLEPAVPGRTGLKPGDVPETIAWRPVMNGTPHQYAADYYEQPERRLVFYVATYLSSRQGGRFTLRLRTERGHNVYLDGVKIGEAFYQKPGRLDFPLTLEPGRRHLLLIKVFSAGGVNTGWTAGLTDAQGKPAQDVTVWLAP